MNVLSKILLTISILMVSNIGNARWVFVYPPVVDATYIVRCLPYEVDDDKNDIHTDIFNKELYDKYSMVLHMKYQYPEYKGILMMRWGGKYLLPTDITEEHYIWRLQSKNGKTYTFITKDKKYPHRYGWYYLTMKIDDKATIKYNCDADRILTDSIRRWVE